MAVIYMSYTDVMSYNDPTERYAYAALNCVRAFASSTKVYYFSASRDYIIAAYWLSNPTSNLYGIIARSTDNTVNTFWLIEPSNAQPFNVTYNSILGGYYCYITSYTSISPDGQYVYPDFNSALQAVNDASPEPPSIEVPITYIPIGCSLSGPDEALQGDEVSVIVTSESGMIIRDPTQGNSISVYNKDGYIPFTYENGQIKFTVPTS